MRNNLGLTLVGQGHPSEAAACYQEAIQLDTNFADAHNNLGNIFFKQDHYEEAIACYRQALRADPRYADAHVNLGNAMLGQGLRSEAAASFQQALAVDAGHKVARWNLALLRLSTGDFVGGWPDYELRWAQPGRKLREFQQPRWDGAPLGGKTILVHAEQGCGDTLQFMRYLPLLKKRGGRVVFECQKALYTLLLGIPGVDLLVALGDPLPIFDLHTPLLSLPNLLGATAEIPPLGPYLKIADVLVERWRQTLATSLAKLAINNGQGSVNVGIAWQGDPRHQWDHHRSFPVTMFESLAGIPGVSLVSLQKQSGAEQLDSVGAGWPIVNFVAELTDFRDTAALMRSLDLVISCDTAIAHLAGALGVPIWLALSTNVDWRWQLERTDCPWYPTMRLFRQQRLGDWSEVFESIKNELRPWALRYNA